MNRMGQFDHVDYNGIQVRMRVVLFGDIELGIQNQSSILPLTQVKCRSNCEDQINSLFVTTSNYPNRKTLVYREEFCILAKNLLDKCDGPKRKPLEREYPNICSTLAPLKRLKKGEFCANNQWSIPKPSAGIANCTKMSCKIEDVIMR